MEKVCKFGGSSLADSQEFKKVKQIIQKDPERKTVVVSALGKGKQSENKITDLLYLIFQHSKFHVDGKPLFEIVKNRYLTIQKELGLSIDLTKDFEILWSRIQKGEIEEDELVSRGEYFSAKLLADYLNYDFIDSQNLIHFNYDGKVEEKETYESIKEAKKLHNKMVVPGFYGSYPNGHICLFSRGGSDVTGSILAAGLKAGLYENFTDVSGFYMTDPKIVDNPRKISEISYDELRELSYMGANVIHQETILPLMKDNIPLVILNTDQPEEPGTWIRKNPPDRHHLITGITGKKNFMALTFVKRKNDNKLTVILRVLNVFEAFKIPVEHIPTSIDSFSVVVEKKAVEDRLYDVIAELKKIESIISIQEDDDIALLAVVGQNMVKRTGTSGLILSIFGEENINIKLIDQGREEFNIIIGVSNKDFDKSIRALYARFAHEKIDATQA